MIVQRILLVTNDKCRGGGRRAARTSGDDI
jgi:hypothetical protein